MGEVFSELVGQDRAVETLRRAVDGRRHAMTHAWLFVGPPGSGRSNAAKAFAARFGQPVSVDNLRGVRVAAMEGSQAQAFLDGIAAGRDLTVVATATTAAAFDALRDGSADFALMSIRSGYALISHDKSRRVGFVGPAVADHGLGDTVHIILPRNKDALRRSLNQAIAEIRADGTGHRIVRRHFPVNLD